MVHSGAVWNGTGSIPLKALFIFLRTLPIVCTICSRLMMERKPGRSRDSRGNACAFSSSRAFFMRYFLFVTCGHMRTRTRSLHELRTWAAELASAGIRATGDRAGTGDIPTAVPKARRATGQHGLRLFEGDLGDDAAGVEEEEDDLEGGSRAVGHVAPLFLVVANKRDVGDGFRRDGEAFAAELGAPHVTVVSERGVEPETCGGKGRPWEGGGEEGGTERAICVMG